MSSEAIPSESSAVSSSPLQAQQSDSPQQTVSEIAFEDITEIKKKIKLKIPASRYKNHFELQLNNVAQKTNFKGFRPGKVPRAMVEKLHGGKVRLDVIDELVNAAIQEIRTKRSLDIINVSELDIDPSLLTAAPSAAIDIEFSASLILYPKPDIKGYKGLAVTVTRPRSGDKEVDEVIERMREARAKLEPVSSRKSPKPSDIISGEAQITIEGEEESRPEPISIEASDSVLPQEVRDQLKKFKLGEPKEISVVFPDDYRDANMRGKKAKYKLTINGLSEKILPVVDDEFAKGAEFGVENVAQLKTKVSESLQKEIEERSRNDCEIEIIKAIIEKNEFEVPDLLVDDEIRNLAVRSGVIDPKAYDVSKLPVESLRPGLGAAATQRVKATIVVDRIAEIEKLKATSEEMEAKISQMSNQFGVPEAEIKKFIFQDGRGVNMLLDITRSKVMDFLIAGTKVEYQEAKIEAAS